MQKIKAWKAFFKNAANNKCQDEGNMADDGVAEDGAELNERQAVAIVFDEADEGKKSVATPYEIGDADDPSLGVSDDEDWYPERIYEDINLLIVPEQAHANNEASSSDAELISASEEGCCVVFWSPPWSYLR